MKTGDRKFKSVKRNGTDLNMNIKDKKYNWINKAVGMVAVTTAVLLFSACGAEMEKFNPSFVSLTPQAQPTQSMELQGNSNSIAENSNHKENEEAVKSEKAETETTESPMSSDTETSEQQTGADTNHVEQPEVGLTTELSKEDFNAADFFNGAVFAGDSVLSHFYWKVPFKEKETFGGSDFLVAISYSARKALKPVSEDSSHPMYRGEQRHIWDSMALLKAKRAILFFGLNDIGVDGVEGFCDNYKKVIENIKEAVPDIRIYIISTTPMRADMETKKLTNANITAANELMQEYCSNQGLGFIDVATGLKDETGAIAKNYSDGTNVHETLEAYQYWRDVLVDYAKQQLLLEQLQ